MGPFLGPIFSIHFEINKIVDGYGNNMPPPFIGDRFGSLSICQKFGGKISESLYVPASKLYALFHRKFLHFLNGHDAGPTKIGHIFKKWWFK